MIKKNSDKLLYLPILLLFITLIIKLVDQSKMIFIFPLDGINDMSSYMAQLFFLKVCGFHNFCPYWYSGFISFIATPPAWYFFSLPLYYLLNNVQLVSYTSLILMYIISFFTIRGLSKKEKISNKKSTLFFFLFFANAIAIGNFIRMGRFVSLFAFMIILLLATLLYNYKDKMLDKKFLLFIPLYFILILSHLQEMVLGHFLILGFLLIKNNYEKLKIIIYGLISWILASFWYIPFIKNLFSSPLLGDYEGLNYWWTKLDGINVLTNILTITLPTVLIFLFYLYYRQDKNKKELLFYSPILILAFLFLIRATSWIPIIRNISVDPMILFLLIFTIILFLKIDFSRYKLERIAYLSLTVLVIISIIISLFVTPYFQDYGDIDKDSLFLLNKARDKLFILLKDNIISSNSYNSYIPIAYNISVVSGWYPYLSNQEYLIKIGRLSDELSSGKCYALTSELNVKSILTYDDYCEFLVKCSYNKIEQKGRACLFYIN